MKAYTLTKLFAICTVALSAHASALQFDDYNKGIWSVKKYSLGENKPVCEVSLADEKQNYRLKFMGPDPSYMNFSIGTFTQGGHEAFVKIDDEHLYNFPENYAQEWLTLGYFDNVRFLLEAVGNSSRIEVGILDEHSEDMRTFFVDVGLDSDTIRAITNCFGIVHFERIVNHPYNKELVDKFLKEHELNDPRDLYKLDLKVE